MILRARLDRTEQRDGGEKRPSGGMTHAGEHSDAGRNDPLVGEVTQRDRDGGFRHVEPRGVGSELERRLRTASANVVLQVPCNDKINFHVSKKGQLNMK